ncbi:MAG: glycosyl hydrolase family 28-related protein, partial [Verrucomicrobiota bacterium]
MRLLLFVGLLFLSPVVVAQDAAYRFPQGLPGILDVRDFGAIGDGVADDTEAIQAAIDESGGKDTEFVGIVYLPAGTYRLTGALVANRGRRGSGVGPWIWGESRDSVVLKLDDQVNRGRKTDRATGREAAKANGDPPPLVEVGDPNDPDQIVKSVLQLHPFEEGVKTSANWFMRNIRRLTIDVGDNPEVDGIRYYASNDGILSDVSVIGAGAIGINCSMLGEAGPSLIQNVSVKGFATGIRSQWAYGQTMSGITIEDCRAAGLELAANVVGIENLTI